MRKSVGLRSRAGRRTTLATDQRLGRADERRGAVTVEFALVAPIFFTLLIVSIEFSRMNVIRHSADQAAYEAAREAMVPGATADEAIAAANNILNVVGARGSNIEVDPPVLDDDTDQVQVTVRIPLNRNGYVVPRFTANRFIVGEATLRTERVTGVGD
ncbi:MAG: pilus assembly protein [Planctomycetales bacterium]|nr:pilus assembly protein [Planctomycetales bacterium]